MSPSLNNIKHILKDSFDFINKENQNKTIGMKIGVADIKSLYTNITHELGIKAMQLWITELKKKIPLLQRFPKNFNMEALLNILYFNYFYINGIYLHQVKCTPMWTPFAVVYENLVVALIEDSMFKKLPENYPKDIVESYLKIIIDS